MAVSANRLELLQIADAVAREKCFRAQPRLATAATRLRAFLWKGNLR